MMTCVSERSGIASSVMFLIDHSPISVATPMKRKTMNLLWAHASMILLIMASLLLLLLLMLRVILRLGVWRRLPARLMLRVISLRRLLAASSAAAAVTHAGHSHAACRRFQFALGINQEVGRSHDALARLESAKHDESVIHLRT